MGIEIKFVKVVWNEDAVKPACMDGNKMSPLSICSGQYGNRKKLNFSLLRFCLSYCGSINCHNMNILLVFTEEPC